jgi:hypothetical protein
MKGSSAFAPKHEQITIDTSALASDESYIFVYPVYVQDKHFSINQDVLPCLLFFRSEEITVKKLIEKVRAKCPERKLGQDLNFTDPEGSIIRRYCTIKEVKNFLKVDNINGAAFYLSENEPAFFKSDHTHMSDECCVGQYAANYQFQRNHEFVQLNF